MKNNQIIENVKKLNFNDKLKLGCFLVAVVFVILIIIVSIFVKTNPFIGKWSLWSPTYYSLDGEIEILINQDNTCLYDDSSPYGNDSEGTWSLSKDNKYIYFDWNNPRTKPTALQLVESEKETYLFTNGDKWYKIE